MLVLPERVPAGAAFTATVDVGSQRDRQAVIELRSGAQDRGHSICRGGKGIDPSRGQCRPRRARPVHVLQAALKIPDDPLSENNTLEKGTWADPKTKVLYVEGAPASANISPPP